MGANATEYAFENLVAGEENILAISGALKVLESPGAEYNPLYIFGPSSAGKTHLLQALRCRMETEYPQWNVLCLPAGEFLEECEHAWQNNATIELRQQLWRLDCLMIDDVHQLVQRPAALDELYHAFNRLVADGRQLVFTSRLAPAEMSDLPLSLRSRFQSGLVVSLESPREQLLRDIVEQECQQSGVRPTREAARYLCNEIRTVRDLRGVLHQLGEGANGKPKKVSVDEIKSLLEQHAARRVTIGEVARAVCQYFHVDLAKVRSPSRQQSLVQARQLAMHLARELTTAPLTEIGGFFGGRDHTTVLYACRKVAEEIRTSPFTAKASREVHAMLRG